jgi:hypothetical protein
MYGFSVICEDCDRQCFFQPMECNVIGAAFFRLPLLSALAYRGSHLACTFAATVFATTVLGLGIHYGFFLSTVKYWLLPLGVMYAFSSRSLNSYLGNGADGTNFGPKVGGSFQRLFPEVQFDSTTLRAMVDASPVHKVLAVITEQMEKATNHNAAVFKMTETRAPILQQIMRQMLFWGTRDLALAVFTVAVLVTGGNCLSLLIFFPLLFLKENEVSKLVRTMSSPALALQSAANGSDADYVLSFAGGPATLTPPVQEEEEDMASVTDEPAVFVAQAAPPVVSRPMCAPTPIRRSNTEVTVEDVDVEEEEEAEENKTAASAAEATPEETARDATSAAVDTGDVEEGDEFRVAVIGYSCILPGGESVRESWEMIRDGLDNICEVPRNRLDIDAYYDEENPKDKIYCRRGGFIPDFDFNPREFNLNMNQVNTKMKTLHTKNPKANPNPIRTLLTVGGLRQ